MHQGTSLQQLQTCGCNLPGEALSKWPTPATIAMVTHHLHPPRTAPTAHDSTQPVEANYPTRDSCCSKCDKTGHWGPKCHGDKPLQPKNAPPPRNAPPTWSQHGKSRCPPRNHNHCHGLGDKTDTTAVGEDHSPQDEIALHYIQPIVTVRNTHPKKIMVGDIHAP